MPEFSPLSACLNQHLCSLQSASVGSYKIEEKSPFTLRHIQTHRDICEHAFVHTHTHTDMQIHPGLTFL